MLRYRSARIARVALRAPPVGASMFPLLSFIAILVLVVAGLGTYLWLSFRWLRKETIRDRYFGRPIAQRRALKTEIARRARAFVPIVAALGRVLPRPTVEQKFRGVSFNTTICPRNQFESATHYTPDARDIFVATQMKCGTTWMQQVVYEVLLGGTGDLSDSGHRHMYALSPWIESTGSVSMQDAPRIGRDGARIIKTHFSALLCPYSEDARYIYVARHPVSCFASCMDFIRFLGGPMAPSAREWLDKYCSDDMWWQAWPEHVAGWWDWSIDRPNVLFVHYEDMLSDLGAQVDRVAAFLDAPLAKEQAGEVTRKSRFAYMKEHEESFEMTAPTYFSMASGSYFASGRADRDQDVGPAERDRIIAFCRERLAGSRYPLEQFYPDVAGV
jgi:hypothetical protein